jgi:hypothetical protein
MSVQTPDDEAGVVKMTDAQIERVLEGLRYVFTSPNEADSNLETANIVDGLYRLARAIDRLAVEVSKTGVSVC